MATDTSSSPGGAVAQAKDEAKELVSSAQEQVSAKAHALGGEANLKVRYKLDQRSTYEWAHAWHEREGYWTQLRTLGHWLQRSETAPNR